MPIQLGGELKVEELRQVPLSSGAERTAYRATREAEARVLLLIDGFSRKTTGPRTLAPVIHGIPDSRR